MMGIVGTLGKVLLPIAACGASSSLDHWDVIHRTCKIFCSGPLLDAVQQSGIFNDSKTFVDMPLKEDPEVAMQAFSKLTSPISRDVLKGFLTQYFGEPGQELHSWTPPDFVNRPPSLDSIADEELRSWSFELNDLWKVLGRMQDAEVAKYPQRHSALKRRFGMIVPGGRFRETYYWDSYWIVRGLLVSGMVETAMGVVENLLDDVRNFGFVPNGGRIYYLDRSQPPFLTQMVLAIHNASPNMTWLASVVPVLEKEYRFWMDPRRGHVITVRKKSSSSQEEAKLNIFFSSEESPRPESYVEDQATAVKAEQQLGRLKQQVWRGLRAGAESGWDFSSRWLDSAVGGAPNLTTVNASAVVPVDLNCVLYKVELGLSRIHSELDNSSASAFYKKEALQRALSMDSLLWNHTVNSYKDYRLDMDAHSAIVSLSDYSAPLWAGLFGPGKSFAPMGASLQRSGLMQTGGGSTTTLFSGQQWDAPNAWAPLQLMLVEGLDRVQDNSDAKHIADRLATDWLQSGLAAWKRTHVMYEKYDAFKPGFTGGGGEYHPQIGFGWTNGVALALLVRENASHKMKDTIEPQILM